MTDRQLMQQALDALTTAELVVEDEMLADEIEQAFKALRDRLAHCDRCGKKLGGEGDIQTCTPKPEQEPVHQWREKHSAYWYDGYPDNDDGGGPYETRTLYTTPSAAPMNEFEEAVAAVDNTLHHAIDHWQDKASEQAALLRECRFAIDELIKKKPILTSLLCGSNTLGNLRASLYDYRVLFDDTPPAAQPATKVKP
jgi:hypothetical protein